METKTQVSAYSAESVPLHEDISQNTLDGCDTRLNKASLPMQNFTDSLIECYVRLVRLPENIHPNEAVKASEFNSFECANISQQHVSSKNCHYIELDNHSSYCLTCKQLIQDFHQFKQNVQRRGNESSFCNSSFSHQKGSESRRLSTHDNKLSTAAAEIELNVNEDEEKNQDQNLINKQKGKIYVYKCSNCQKRFIHKGSLVDHMKFHTNEEIFTYPACNYSANEILETADPIITTNQNLKDDSEYTEEDEHKGVELKNKETYVNKEINVEMETNIICSTPEPQFDILSNASEEDTLEPHFEEDIKIEIVEDPIVAVNLKLNFEQDEFKKNVKSQGNENSLCSSDTKFMETEQNLHQHDDENIYNCTLCPKQYTRKHLLEYHMKSHMTEQPFKCKECNYATKTHKELRYHYWSKHNKPMETEEPNQNSICSICCRYCGTSARLKKHMLAHTKQYKCKICNMNFSYRQSLSRHVLRHTGIKRFACHFCHNRYTTKFSLEYHIQTHTGEKPYSCRQCNFAGKTSSELRKHCKHIPLMDEDVRIIQTGKKKTVCPICNKRILSLKRHMLTHTGEKPFKCDICQKRYTAKPSLEYHVKSHTGEKSFRCTECDYSAKTNKQVRYHYDNKHAVKVANSDRMVNTKKTTVCRICNKKILDTNLKRHMLIHTGEKPFECNICQRHYTAKTSLEYHIQSHTGEKPFRCTECDYSAKLDAEVQKHYNRVHTVKVANFDGNNVNTRKTAVCPICNKRILSLKRHMLTHTGEKPFECDICHNRYKNKKSLEYHIKSHTGEKPFRCTECNYSAKLNKEIREHYNRMHTVKVTNSDTKKTVCPICNKRIVHLRRHMLTHTGKKLFECNICHMRYKSKNSLEFHLKSHTGEKPFRCTECDYSAKTNKQVQGHYNNMHAVKVANTDGTVNTKKTSVCPICNKVILQINLNRHMLTHTGEKPFECNICHNRYTTKNSLEYHIKSHTGEKPFRCTKCDYSAKTDKAIRYHYNCKHTDKVKPTTTSKTSHKNKNISYPGVLKRFDCDICQKCFRNRAFLIHHRKTHTGEKSFKCTDCDYLAIDNNTLQNHYKNNHTFFVIEEVNVEQPHLDNVRSKILETINPTVAVNRNLKCNSENVENDQHNASEEEVLEPHFQNIKIEILEATSEPQLATLRNASKEEPLEPHLRNIKSNIFEITDPTSKLCFDVLNNVPEENVSEPHFHNFKSEILEATDPPFEPHLDILNNASEENVREPHLRNLKSNICEAIDPTVNLEWNFEESQHIQNSTHQEVEAKDKTTHVNTHTKVKTKTSEAPNLKEQPKNIQAIKPEEVEIKDEDNPIFTAVREYLTSEPGFEMNESHFQNLTSNIFEATHPVNFEQHFEEPEHIQNSTHEEEVKDKTTNVNTHTEVKTKTSEALYLKEQPRNIQAIKPEEVQIKGKLTYKDNPVFTAVQEDEDNLGKHLHISTAEQPYACNVCKFETTNEDNFKRHMHSHKRDKLFACNLCEFKTAYKRNLRIHMYSHRDDKPFTCSSCNFKTVRRQYLKIHMRTHSGEKPFVCSVCGFKTAHNYLLQRHLCIHTGEVLFACTYCEYRSITKGSLNNHMSIHTGEKPFACHLCDYKTNRKNNLSSHMLFHTEEEPFACDLCDFRSKHKHSVTKHMLIHSGEKRFACDLCECKTAHKNCLQGHMQGRLKHILRRGAKINPAPPCQQFN